MKTSIDDLEKTFCHCSATGKIFERSLDWELIVSLKRVAENGLGFIKSVSKGLPRDSLYWTFVFRDHYESLRGLVEACLLCEGIAADNHQCCNAYLCWKHPELGLDWEFLETIRLKRNAINYRGHMLDYGIWKMLELKFDVHFTIVQKEIQKKIVNGLR